MQLEKSALRDALHTAALALIMVPVAATAQTSAQQPANQIDVTTLFYGEQGRTQVVEPVVRFAHLVPDGQSFALQLGIDVITGASPTGAVPSLNIQTRTSASGRIITSAAGKIPTAPFRDNRIGVEAEWQKPWTPRVASTLGAHFSREKDYQSLGVDGRVSTEVMRRLVTLSIGGGISRDAVFPVGGTPEGLSDGTIVSTARNRKDVDNLTLGVSRILTRRWMMALNGTRTMERGYLTEPYKVVSLTNLESGLPIDEELTDKRPSTRNRSSLLLSSVYHFTDDVLYTSYRYYWDTWDVRSHTVDLKYRHDLGDSTTYIEPLLRFYKQSAASFYTAALRGRFAPDFATSDYRLGNLRTVTVGATYGFQFLDTPGNWTLRGQYIRQAGDRSPPGAFSLASRFDLAPPVNIYALVVGYSFGY